MNASLPVRRPAAHCFSLGKGWWRGEWQPQSGASSWLLKDSSRSWYPQRAAGGFSVYIYTMCGTWHYKLDCPNSMPALSRRPITFINKERSDTSFITKTHPVESDFCFQRPGSNFSWKNKLLFSLNLSKWLIFSFLAWRGRTCFNFLICPNPHAHHFC